MIKFDDFSKLQQKIITEKDKNIMVSASAGSGKTTVMISRIAKLIEEGHAKIEQLIVLTFTNNAALDMKQKLYEHLNENAAVNKNAYNALFGISQAEICTIDSFCKKTVQKYFYLCGEDAAFSVLSDAESEVLKDIALDKVISSAFLQDKEKLEEILDENFTRRNLDDLKNILLSIYNYLTISDNRENYIKNISALSYDENLQKNKAMDIIKTYVQNIAKKLYFNYENLKKDVLFYKYEDGFLEYIDNVLKSLQSIYEETDNETFIEKIMNYEIISTNKKGKKEEKDFIENYLKPAKDSYQKTFAGIKKMIEAKSLSEMYSFLKSRKNNIDFLTDLAEKFIEEYSLMKKDKALLDFNDLEQKALFLLQNENVAEDINSKFKYCFVDEYQDINKVQEAILKILGANKNYFGVGDAKQSIYGFRLSSPEIFINKFKEYENAPAINSAINLSENYRSELAILNFVNKVFSKVMTEKTSGVNYEKTSMLTSGSKENPGICVELNIIKKDKNKKLGNKLPAVYSVKNHEYTESEETSNAKKEAGIAIDIISKLKDAGADFKDISILSRKKRGNFVKQFFEEFEKNNIPVKANFNINLLENYEIIILHNLLKCINNFYDDYVLIKVLTSPLFKFTFDELYAIRQQYPDEYYFYNALVKSASENKRIENFIKEIENLNLISQNYSVFEFVKFVIDKYNYKLLAQGFSENSIQNIELYKAFIKGLKVLSVNDYCTLTKGDNIEVKNNIVSGILDDYVSINTVHSSKGLEYPYVILIGTGESFNEAYKTKSMLINGELGIALKDVDFENNEKMNNIGTSAIKILKESELIAEEIRLLYVALTRAKKKLFVIGRADTEKLKQIKNEDDIFECSNYLSLICGSFNDAEFEKLKTDTDFDLIFNNTAVASCFILNSEDIIKAQQEISTVKTTGKANPKTVINIADAIKISENITNITNYNLKNNVTELSKTATKNNEESTYEANLFSADKTSIETGTMYHNIFTKFNFINDDASLILSNESEEVKRKADKNIIEKFIKSDVYKLAGGKKIFKEVPFLLYDEIKEFEFLGDKVLLQGILDLLIIEEDGFYIVDYKATNAKDEDVLQRYKNQLTLYKIATEKILNIPCKKCYIYKIFSGKMLEIMW